METGIPVGMFGKDQSCPNIVRVAKICRDYMTALPGDYETI